MTGTGAGAIDFDWLMEHIRVRDILIEAPEAEDTEEKVRVPTFCLDVKALPAAEQFLLARYTLHEQVYFHKATRCIEHMIARLLRSISVRARKPSSAARETGLPRDHPLLRYFGKEEPSVSDYLALDDFMIIGALDAMSRAADQGISKLAARLRDRDLYKTLDLRIFGEEQGLQRNRGRHIDAMFKEGLASGAVLKDERAAISIYTQIGGDDEKAHKKLHILDRAEGPKEITPLSKLVGALATKTQFTRYYFEHPEDRDRALQRQKEFH